MKTTGVWPEALAARISWFSRSEIDAVRLSDMSVSSPGVRCLLPGAGRAGWRSAGHWHHCHARLRGSHPWESLVRPRGHRRRRPVAADDGQRLPELAAGGDGELREDLGQVVLDGARAEEQLGGDLRVGQARPGRAGDSRWGLRQMRAALSGRDAAWVTCSAPEGWRLAASMTAPPHALRPRLEER